MGAAGEIGAAHGAGEDQVPAEHPDIRDKAQPALRVAGGVEDFDCR